MLLPHDPSKQIGIRLIIFSNVIENLKFLNQCSWEAGIFFCGTELGHVYFKPIFFAQHFRLFSSQVVLRVLSLPEHMKGAPFSQIFAVQSLVRQVLSSVSPAFLSQVLLV